MSELNRPVRDKTSVPIGSGRFYLVKCPSRTMPSFAELVALCESENLIGETTGGATFNYSCERHEEKDDHGTLSRNVLIDEAVSLKGGLFSWGLDAMADLISTGRVEEADNGRFKVLRIGGLDNDNEETYVIVFEHTDPKYAPLYIAIMGTNGAGLTVPFARNHTSKLEPEFQAEPHDKGGTLALIFEDRGTQTEATASTTGDQPADNGGAEPDSGTEAE